MPNKICHFEIGCRDETAAREFYSKLFDWTFDAQNSIHIDGSEIGGHITSLGHEPHLYTTFYVMVDDVADSISQAEQLGGKKVVGPVKIPTGTFAWIQDPQGNTIGLFHGA